MSRETLSLALDKLNNYDTTIGGGEPTCHPDFDHFLTTVINHPITRLTHNGPGVVTNGKNTQKARELLELSKKGFIRPRLSLDHFHEKIDSELEKEWVDSGQMIARELDHREPLRMGRAKNLPKPSKPPLDNACICQVLFVRPSGLIQQCGCEGSPVIGSVYDKEVPQHTHKCGMSK